jgi:transposase
MSSKSSSPCCVILDNLSSHKNEEAAHLIASAGARLMFLPPYTPDLNPIEMAFAKFKELLRQGQARTVDALWDLIGRTLNLFTPQECANYDARALTDAMFNG